MACEQPSEAGTSVHLNGTAFGNPQSFAGDPDGHLYFYTSSLDTSMQDVAKNPKASFALVLEELGNYCTNGRHQFEAKGDPEDSRCARLTVMGAMRVCAPGTEVTAANSTLFGKHPEMKTWPASFWTLDINDMFLINMYGGATILKAADYYKANVLAPEDVHTNATVAAVEAAAVATSPITVGMPPWPTNETAHTARWLAHQSNYGFISTTSAQYDGGVAFGNVVSVVDGTTDNSTGHLYFYVTDLDATMVDVAKNPACSFTMSEEWIGAGGNNCSSHGLDPEDPTCTRLVLSGKLVQVNTTTEEYTFAKGALFARHPIMKSWPSGHGWKIMTLAVEHIWMINFYGGAHDIDPKEYYAYKL